MPLRPFLSPDQVGDVPLPDILTAIERELALRDRVYPHLVRSGRMTQVEAERHYTGMVGARRNRTTSDLPRLRVVGQGVGHG